MTFILVGLLLAYSVLSVGRLFSGGLKNAGYLYLNRAASQSEPSVKSLYAAEAFFQDAITLSGAEQGSTRGIGFTLGLKGDVNQAVSFLHEVDEPAPMFAHLGSRYHRLQQYEPSVLWYEEAVAAEDENGQLWHAYGRALELQGRLAEARKAYTTGWNLDMPENTDSLVSVLIEMNDVRTAEAVLRRTLEDVEDTPKRVEWWSMLGTLAIQQGRFDDAIDIYERALAEFPRNHLLQLGLGEVYLVRGDSLESVLAQFYVAHNNDDGGRSAMRIAELMTAKERFEEAWPWFDVAIQANPNNARWYAAYVNSARVGGQPNRAIEIGKAGLERFPEYGPLYSQLAAVFIEIGQFTEAEQAIRLALLHLPQPSADVWLRAGTIFEKNGNYEEARQAYEQVLILRPEEQRGKAGIARLTPESDSTDK